MMERQVVTAVSGDTPTDTREMIDMAVMDLHSRDTAARVSPMSYTYSESIKTSLGGGREGGESGGMECGTWEVGAATALIGTCVCVCVGVCDGCTACVPCVCVYVHCMYCVSTVYDGVLCVPCVCTVCVCVRTTRCASPGPHGVGQGLVYPCSHLDLDLGGHGVRDAKQRDVARG